MNIQLIRNATLRLDYAGVRFLLDPILAEQGAYPGLPGSPNSYRRNPTAGLPVPVQDIVQVDAVIVTHTHQDHWDDAAVALVPKGLPIFTQHVQDQELLQSQGFTDVRLLQEAEFRGVLLTQTPGQHGSDAVMAAAGAILGEVCGVVFTHPEEKKLYVAGDTVWNQYVADSLQQYQPDVVVLNTGDAQISGLGSVTMTKEDVHAVYQAAPQATLIATHLEATNHAMLTRQELQAFAAEQGMTDRLRVPADGESYTF
jgi:L-ascorbate metabolism protein UlaG (beta-lactamase superfamily)